MAFRLKLGACMVNSKYSSYIHVGLLGNFNHCHHLRAITIKKNNLLILYCKCIYGT